MEYIICTRGSTNIKLWQKDPSNKVLKNFLFATRKYVSEYMVTHYGHVETYRSPEEQAA